MIPPEFDAMGYVELRDRFRRGGCGVGWRFLKCCQLPYAIQRRRPTDHVTVLYHMHLRRVWLNLFE